MKTLLVNSAVMNIHARGDGNCFNLPEINSDFDVANLEMSCSRRPDRAATDSDSSVGHLEHLCGGLWRQKVGASGCTYPMVYRNDLVEKKGQDSPLMSVQRREQWQVKIVAVNPISL